MVPRLAKDNVTVYPGVERIDANTLIASDGQRAEVDIIIWATGFEVANPPIAEHIVGVSGRCLDEEWQGSPSAYLGTVTEHCPNLFLCFGPNLYSFSSAFVIIEAQLAYIVHALQQAKAGNFQQLQLKPERSAKYNAELQDALQASVWNSGCASYFMDKNGRNSTNWPWTTLRLRRELRRFRAADYQIDK